MSDRSSPGCQPLPSVEPAFDFAGLLDELDASVFPALLSDDFEGLPDRDDFAMVCFLSAVSGSRSPPARRAAWRLVEAIGASRVEESAQTPQPRSAASSEPRSSFSDRGFSLHFNSKHTPRHRSNGPVDRYVGQPWDEDHLEGGSDAPEGHFWGRNVPYELHRCSSILAPPAKHAVLSPTRAFSTGSSTEGTVGTGGEDFAGGRVATTS